MQKEQFNFFFKSIYTKQNHVNGIQTMIEKNKKWKNKIGKSSLR
jgi:hypothetical protein